MFSDKSSRQYVLFCVFLLICVQHGFSCEDSIFINSLSIISECRSQMHDILHIMCRLPSMLDVFGLRDSSAIHARQPLTMDDLVCECCFKACFPSDFNRYCHLAK